MILPYLLNARYFGWRRGWMATCLLSFHWNNHLWRLWLSQNLNSLLFPDKTEVFSCVCLLVCHLLCVLALLLSSGETDPIEFPFILRPPVFLLLRFFPPRHQERLKGKCWEKNLGQNGAPWPWFGWAHCASHCPVPSTEWEGKRTAPEPLGCKNNDDSQLHAEAGNNATAKNLDLRASCWV